MHFLVSLGSGEEHTIVNELFNELSQLPLNCESPVQCIPSSDLLSSSEYSPQLKGDPISPWLLFAIAIGPGGALSVALAKDGVITQLARILEKYLDRKVDIQIQKQSGESIKLSGSVADIRRALKELSQELPKE